MQVFSQAYALLIGIGSYAHAPQFNVPITAADAGAVAAVLRDPQSCDYPSEQVTLLSAASASRDAVLTARVIVSLTVLSHWSRWALIAPSPSSWFRSSTSPPIA